MVRSRRYLSPLLLLLTFAESLDGGGGMFLLGGLVGAMDVAMNANAVEVENVDAPGDHVVLPRLWSLGGLIGAASGGVIMAQFGVLPHAVLVTWSALPARRSPGR